jgi:DNA-binding transcriptional regulator YhcF (GntR family)
MRARNLLQSLLAVSQAHRRPMYLQLMEQIRHWIAVSDWLPGHELPSIRALAVEVGVSVIIAKRAYLELERGGGHRDAKRSSRVGRPRRSTSVKNATMKLDADEERAARVCRARRGKSVRWRQAGASSRYAKATFRKDRPNNTVQELSIRWSVDGQKFFFNRPVSGRNPLFSINADGSPAGFRG